MELRRNAAGSSRGFFYAPKPFPLTRTCGIPTKIREKERDDRVTMSRQRSKAAQGFPFFARAMHRQRRGFAFSLSFFSHLRRTARFFLAWRVCARQSIARSQLFHFGARSYGFKCKFRACRTPASVDRVEGSNSPSSSARTSVGICVRIARTDRGCSALDDPRLREIIPVNEPRCNRARESHDDNNDDRI